MTIQRSGAAADGAHVRFADPPRPGLPNRRHSEPGRSSIATIGIVAVLFALVLTACSGGAAPSNDVATLADPSASSSVSPSASLDPEAAMDAFAQCMRDHGVDIHVSSAGEGGGGGNGTIVSGTAEGKPGGGTDKSKADLDAADKACAPLLPRGGLNGPGATMDPEMQQKLLDFSKCMRDHGIDMPDPQFSNGGATVQIGGPDDNGSKIDPTSQAYKDAQTACESLLPAKGAGEGPVTQESKP